MQRLSAQSRSEGMLPYFEWAASQEFGRSSVIATQSRSQSPDRIKSSASLQHRQTPSSSRSIPRPCLEPDDPRGARRLDARAVGRDEGRFSVPLREASHCRHHTFANHAPQIGSRSMFSAKSSRIKLKYPPGEIFMKSPWGDRFQFATRSCCECVAEARSSLVFSWSGEADDVTSGLPLPGRFLIQIARL